MKQRGRREPRDNILTQYGTPQQIQTKSKEKGGLKIIQKVKVEQVIKSKKKTGITSLKKLYSKLRKQLIALFKKNKREAYKSKNDILKKQPSKGRPAKRKAVKEELKSKLIQLLKMLPSATKLKKSEVQKCILEQNN